MSKVKVLQKLSSYVSEFCRQPKDHQLVIFVGTIQNDINSDRKTTQHNTHYSQFHRGWACPITEKEHSSLDQKTLALNLITRLNNQCNRTTNDSKHMGRTNTSITWTMIPQTKGFYTFYQSNVVQTNFENGPQEHHIRKTIRYDQVKTSRPWDLQIELCENKRLPSETNQKDHYVQLILSTYKNITISIFHHASYLMRFECFDDISFQVMIHICKILEPSKNKFDNTHKQADYIPKVELYTPPKLSRDQNINEGIFKYIAEVLLNITCLLCGSTMKHTDQSYTTLPPIQLSLLEI
jgi:hypothetical protein